MFTLNYSLKNCVFMSKIHWGERSDLTYIANVIDKNIKFNQQKYCHYLADENFVHLIIVYLSFF